MTRRFRHPLRACALVAALAGVAGTAHAGAFYIQEQSAKGLGRAYSGEAADVGVDSLWWNPAAIAQIDGLQTYAGVHAVSVQGTVTDRGSTIQRPGQAPMGVGGSPSEGNPILFGVVPNTGAAWRVNDRISVGLAVTAPFNFTTKYDDQSWTRYQSLKSRLFSLDVQPTVALHLTRWLDVGAGFDAEYVSATLSNALPNLSPLLPDGSQRLTGDGWNYGYTAGLQLHPSERFTLGVSYRSDIKHDLDGRVQAQGLAGTPYSALAAVDAPGRASFTTPWMATVAARFRATSRLTLQAQVQRVGWSEFDAIRIAYTGGSEVSPQNYQDVTTAAVGADYDVTPSWTVRAGVQYDPTPTPDAGRTARVPDGDRLLFGVGTTVHLGSRMWFDLSGAYIHFEDSTIRSSADAFGGTPLVTPVTLVGDVSGQGAVLSAGAHMRF